MRPDGVFSVANSLGFLYWQWLRRDMAGRYRGSLLGLAWPVLQPLAQIMVLTLIFHRFMGMRWSSADGGGDALDFGLNVFAGLAVFNFFAEILARSPLAVLSQPNLVTKVRFPLMLLPLVTVGAATVHLLMGWLMICGGMLLWREAGPVALLLPLYCLPVIAYGAALAWMLAGLGVYLRDIVQVVPSVTSLLMFLTPIFYPPSVIPDSLAWMVGVNPVGWSVEVFRSLLVVGDLPDTGILLLHCGISLLSLAIAGWLFQLLRKGFPDVI